MGIKNYHTIEIRKLEVEELDAAIDLKIICWPEEVAGMSSYQLDKQKEQVYWQNWMRTANENNDVRLLYGAFENNNLLGAVFGSFAEVEDIPENGIELNGLWVHPNERGKGISLMLLSVLFDEFIKLNINKVVIYNFRNSPSNKYYRKFGCEVMRQESQLNENVPTDVFICDINEFNYRVKLSLSKY